MKVLALLSLFLLALRVPAAQNQDTAVARQIASQVSQPRFAAALWGIKIVSLDSGKTLFETNAEKLFSPASNAKLFTTALALDRLGPDFRIKTSLYAAGRPDAAGTLTGDLVVYGRGDPCINARLHEGDLDKALEPLVAGLISQGVKRITGDVVGDDSFFHGAPFGSGWAVDDLQYYYGAEVSALTINDNVLDLSVRAGSEAGAPTRVTLVPAAGFLTISNRARTESKESVRKIELTHPVGENIIDVSGTISVGGADFRETITFHDPAMAFAWFLKEGLARKGIEVVGKPVSRHWSPGSPAFDPAIQVEVGSMESLPMRDLIREVLKPSQNLYADLLLAQVGAKFASSTRINESTEDSGIRALDKFAVEAGVRKGSLLFEEGSGLSRNNLVTPEAVVRLLQFMNKHRSGRDYYDALPVAGVDGTLRTRMKKTAAEGKVHAKTGSLRWANSLSGFVTAPGGDHLAFSLILNRYQASEASHSARTELDAIAVLLAGGIAE